MTSEQFLDDLAEYLTAKVGKEWYFNFEHDSDALFVKVTIPENLLDQEDEEDGC